MDPVFKFERDQTSLYSLIIHILHTDPDPDILHSDPDPDLALGHEEDMDPGVYV